MSPNRRRYLAKKALLETLESETQIFRDSDPSPEQKIAFKNAIKDRWKKFEREYSLKKVKPAKPDPAIEEAQRRESARANLVTICDRQIEKLKFENAPADQVYAAELKKVKLLQDFDRPVIQYISKENAPDPVKPEKISYAQKIRLQRLNTHLKRQKKEELALIKAGKASKNALEALRDKHEEQTKQFHLDEDIREEKRLQYFRNRNKHGKNYSSDQAVAKINARLHEKIVLETARLKRKLELEEKIAQQEIEKVLTKTRKNNVHDI
jgi:hypothetical protein